MSSQAESDDQHVRGSENEEDLMSRWKVPPRFKVIVGGNTYIDCPTIIRYKGESLFELVRSDGDGLLAINFDVHREDGSRVATIRNGRFVDFEPDGYTLTRANDHFVLLEAATGRAVCEIRLREKARDGTKLEVAAKMYMPDGRLIVFDENETNVSGMTMVGNTFEGAGTAINIE